MDWITYVWTDLHMYGQMELHMNRQMELHLYLPMELYMYRRTYICTDGWTYIWKDRHDLNLMHWRHRGRGLNIWITIYCFIVYLFENFAWHVIDAYLVFNTVEITLITWNLSKPNFLGTTFCAQNRQVFGLNRLIWYRFPTLGLYLKFSLYSIPVYSGFGLDKFHCIQ